MQLSSENIKLAHILEASEIRPQTTSNIFVGLAKNPELKFIPSNISTILKFEANEINLSNNSVASQYDDEFFFEDFEITIGDYFSSYPLVDATFKKAWGEFDDSEEVSATYQLNYKTVEAAIKGLVKHFGNTFFLYIFFEFFVFLKVWQFARNRMLLTRQIIITLFNCGVCI